MSIRRPPFLLLLAGGFTALVAALPVVYLFVRMSESDPDAIAGALFRERTFTLVLTSLTLSVTVAAGALLIGVPIAWALARVDLPARGIWRVLAALPLAIPSYVAAFAWVSTWPGISGFWPLVAIMSLACAPYVTFPVAAALRLSDARLSDVARSLGKSRIATFRRATLPQIAPAALAGALLAALYTLSDFGSPSIMRVQTLTWAVHAAYEGGINRTLAAATAAILVALALLLVLVERLVRARADRGVVGVGRIVRAPLVRSRGAQILALVMMGGVATASLGLPIFALLRRGAEGTARDVDWFRVLESTGTTVLFSAGGAALAVLLGLSVAVLAARYRSTLSGVIESLAYIANGIPGIVVGLSLVFFTLNVVPSLYQTALALNLAYAIIFLPRAIGSARSAIERVPVALEEVSRSLGRGRVRTWWTVTVPLSAPGIAVGGLLVAVTAMKELPTTLMLLPIGSNTLATELWRHTTVTAYAAAAPYALALILVASVPAYFLSRAERDGA